MHRQNKLEVHTIIDNSNDIEYVPLETPPIEQGYLPEVVKNKMLFMFLSSIFLLLICFASFVTGFADIRLFLLSLGVFIILVMDSIYKIYKFNNLYFQKVEGELVSIENKSIIKIYKKHISDKYSVIKVLNNSDNKIYEFIYSHLSDNYLGCRAIIYYDINDKTEKKNGDVFLESYLGIEFFGSENDSKIV